MKYILPPPDITPIDALYASHRRLTRSARALLKAISDTNIISGTSTSPVEDRAIADLEKNLVVAEDICLTE